MSRPDPIICCYPNCEKPVERKGDTCDCCIGLDMERVEDEVNHG